jgi:alpha-tubulin suppressor-like RCC1 family protein
VSLTDVNAGNFSVCGIATDGTAMCWGYGADGQLGKLANLSSTTAITTSVSTADTLNGPFLAFRSLNVGKNHACGVTIGRDIYCWGSNNAGQLGAGLAGGTPSKWKGDSPWRAVSAGEFNTCGLAPGGFVYCSGLNDQGQLGNGAFTPGTGSATPVLAVSAADSLFSSVAVGQSFTCGMPSRGTSVPSCWGLNTSGQIGQGAVNTRYVVPTRITSGGALPTAYDTTSLVAGNLHACAIATVGGTVGATYCWGGNGYGQVGNGVTTNQNLPVVVSGGLALVQLTAGAFHTCGLTATGTAYCWGRNTSGQLGDGTTTSSAVPVAVSGALTFRSISAGELFTCGVAGTPGTSGGTTASAAAVYCWGDNEYGQIGNTTVATSNNTPRLTPIKISFIP